MKYNRPVLLSQLYIRKHEEYLVNINIHTFAFIHKRMSRDKYLVRKMVPVILRCVFWFGPWESVVCDGEIDFHNCKKRNRYQGKPLREFYKLFRMWKTCEIWNIFTYEIPNLHLKETDSNFKCDILVYETCIPHMKWNSHIWKLISHMKFSFYIWN